MFGPNLQFYFQQYVIKDFYLNNRPTFAYRNKENLNINLSQVNQKIKYVLSN